MEFQFLIPIFGIVFGTILTGVIFWKVFDVIKAWINRDKSSIDEEQFERMARAFIQHKKDTERRLKNLETIVTDDKPATGRQLSQKSSAETIEIDEGNSDTADKNSSSGGRLNNMLNKEKTK